MDKGSQRFHKHITDELEAFGLDTDDQCRPVLAKDLVDIVEGYAGLGYGMTTDKDLGIVVCACSDAYF